MGAAWSARGATSGLGAEEGWLYTDVILETDCLAGKACYELAALTGKV